MAKAKVKTKKIPKPEKIVLQNPWYMVKFKDGHDAVYIQAEDFTIDEGVAIFWKGGGYCDKLAAFNFWIEIRMIDEEIMANMKNNSSPAEEAYAKSCIDKMQSVYEPMSNV